MDLKNRTKIELIAKVAVLSALAGLFMYIEFPLPFMPPFLKLDISDIPALIGSFALGPVAGITIELIKNLIHLPVTSSLGVGELANFVVGSFFVATAGYIYRFRKSKGGAVAGMAAGTLVMTAVASIINYFVMLPFYAALFHISLNDIVVMSSKLNGLVSDMRSLIVFAFVPFNIFKGIVISLVTALLYKRVSHLLHRQNVKSGARA